MKHGRGADIFANGDTYNGEYRNGKPHGKGVYTWKNGSHYEGEFKNGLKHGKGKWKKYIQPSSNAVPTKEEIEGQQLNNNFLYYEGEYRYDKKDG